MRKVQPGYRYEIVARQFNAPLKVYETTPANGRRVIASLPPPDNAAIMVAERAWEMQLRIMNQGEDFTKVLEERNNGPRVSFLLTVPKDQALTAQETFSHVYGTVLDLRMVQQPDESVETTSLLYRPSLWKAVLAVNNDLRQRGETRLMKELPLIGGIMSGQEALRLTLFLQTHYRWAYGEDEQPTAAVWAERGELWNDIAEANTPLMERAPRAARAA